MEKGFPTRNSSGKSLHGLRPDLVARRPRDLHDIIRYISRDDRERAQVFALRLVARVEVLREQPEIGRVVPERRLRHIREIILRPYRIVYRVDHPRRLVEISRVWHAARGTPDIP